MKDLWFAANDPDVRRRGTMLFASRPDGVWAVLTQELVYPDDLAQESAQLMGHYGALVHGAGHLLLSAGVHLPPDLHRWSTAPDVAMADLGKWRPGLLQVDSTARLALTRDFDGLRAFAGTWQATHYLVLTPSNELVPTLATRPSLS